jgi:hypothetical protein
MGGCWLDIAAMPNLHAESGMSFRQDFAWSECDEGTGGDFKSSPKPSALGSRKRKLFGVNRKKIRKSDEEDKTRSGDVAVVQQEGAVHLHLDAAHMGVGGDNSWTPSVHPEYVRAMSVLKNLE